MKTTANCVAEVRTGSSHKPVQDSVLFVATCPRCGQEVLQHGYSRVVLFGFLDTVHPIDAYCPACDELWSINTEERQAIAERLSPTSA